MNKTGVAELKAHLSRYLERVKSGQEIVVTERGVPIAKLVPLRAAEPRDSRRERLARAGLLRLGAGRIRASFLRVPKGPRVGASVVQALLNERRQGR